MRHSNAPELWRAQLRSRCRQTSGELPRPPELWRAQLRPAKGDYAQTVLFGSPGSSFTYRGTPYPDNLVRISAIN